MNNEFRFSFDPIDFSLDLCVNCGQVFRWRREGKGRWLGSEGEFWYDVRQIDESNLEIETNGSREEFERLFRFDWDGPSKRRQIAELAPELAPFIQQLPGLRMMRPSSPAETFFCFLCTPNNHLTRITSMIATLGSYGEPMDGQNSLSRFPTVERIADIPELELREKGFGYRGASIPKAAKQLADLGGEDYLQSLKIQSYESARESLIKIHGVGPKLADCIALYALDHTEAVPVDTHIWQAATRLYFPEWKDTNLTTVKYDKIGTLMRDKFGPLAGWAHQYLFFENLLNWRTRK